MEDEVWQSERAPASRAAMGSGGAAPGENDEVRQPDGAPASRAAAGPGGAPPTEHLDGPEPDLERIAGDLADIERALDRLDDGSYWTDEITGEPIPDAVLAEDPTARRVTHVPTEADDAGAQPPVE